LCRSGFMSDTETLDVPLSGINPDLL
jgi:hypothetical protein